MIDWKASGLISDMAKNKDRVIVVCEKCNKSKSILYVVAKRRDQHICMSCIKRKHKHKQGELIEYECIDCGVIKSQKYDSRYHDNWRCHHCAMVYGHKLGKFKITHNSPSEEGKKRISEAVRANWQNPEYVKKWKVARAKTKAKRSRISKQLWKDEARLKRLSAYLMSEDVREKMAKARASQSGRISSIQKLLYKYLDDLGVEYYEEGPETQIGYYVFDCRIVVPDKRDILIECQGDYWHSLPKAVKNDRSKFTYVDRYFPEYEIMYAWEHEFSAKDRVLDRLKLKLGVDIETIDFDFKDVELKEVSSGDVREFLDAYHYIGKGRGGKCFGAYHNGDLVACCVFSSPLRQNIAQQFGSGVVVELSRLCIHPSYHKKNFASWFIARALKNVDSDVVIAYADTTVGHIGTVYRSSNFEFHHNVPPDYWYVDKDGFVMHKRTLYGRARRMSMGESDFAEKYGYYKKWGGEKPCFIRYLK